MEKYHETNPLGGIFMLMQLTQQRYASFISVPR